MQRLRRIIRLGTCIALSGVAVLTLGGCVMGKEFRAAATPAVFNGVSQIVNGLLDGLLASVEVDPETSDDSSTGQ